MRRSPVVGVLLAAGRGSRFDPDGTVNKLLAALPDGTPVAVQAARHLRAVLDDVVAVVPAAGTHGAEVERLAALLAEAGCEVLRCTRAARGMGASLAAGVAARPHAGGWIIALADMPWLAPHHRPGCPGAGRAPLRRAVPPGPARASDRLRRGLFRRPRRARRR